jgi:hypothetical protein
LLEEFLFTTVAKVLAREPYGLSRTVLKFATDAPCFGRLDDRGQADVFAVGTKAGPRTLRTRSPLQVHRFRQTRRPH